MGLSACVGDAQSNPQMAMNALSVKLRSLEKDLRYRMNRAVPVAVHVDAEQGTNEL